MIINIKEKKLVSSIDSLHLVYKTALSGHKYISAHVFFTKEVSLKPYLHFQVKQQWKPLFSKGGSEMACHSNSSQQTAICCSSVGQLPIPVSTPIPHHASLNARHWPCEVEAHPSHVL